MKKFIITTAIALSAVATSAHAAQCQKYLSAVDDALTQKPKISDKQMSEVTSLRAEGEKLCAAGDDDGSVAMLGKALGILGK